jgi:DNA polymerase I-like protein with 3'-5' exonuclease and polymerase domains
MPALKKLKDWEFKGKLVDTLVLARLSNTNRPMHPRCPTVVWDEHSQKNKMIGPHTLMNLGYYANAHKGDFGESAGWETYSDDMLHYCGQDVTVNVAVYRFLQRQLLGFSPYCIQLEMDVAGYMAQQQSNGWKFDIQKAEELEAELAEKVWELETKVHETFKPLPKFIKIVQPRNKKDGSLSSVGLKFLLGYADTVPNPEETVGAQGTVVYTSGAFSRIDWPEFNLGSRQQIADQLISRGWKPTVRTEKGSIIINEPVLQAIENKYPEAKLLGEYFMVSKRQSMLKNWIESFNSETGRLHGYVNSLGAVTGRMTHSKPNLAQVPSTRIHPKTKEVLWGFDGAYGADCRALFIVPKGFKQVGCDASGLELRCLAHYMGDEKYTDTVINGDIHTANQIAAGLPTRNQAKTFI